MSKQYTLAIIKLRTKNILYFCREWVLRLVPDFFIL
nr:MAG TPA: docking domain containing protein [Caudoviricetes sp.]